MKTVFLSLIFLSSLAMGASLHSFHGRNFSPNANDKCGWHVEVSGNAVVLESIPNINNYDNTQDCWGMAAHLLHCIGLTCTQETGIVCSAKDGQVTKDTIVFLNDGNMFYQNKCTGRGFKNYRHY